MNSDFSNLRFNRSHRTIPSRVIWMVGLVALTGLAWAFLPPDAFFWLALLLVVTLGWAASYGWRQSIRVLATFLDYIQNI